MDIQTRPRFNQQFILRIITGGIVLLTALAGLLWWLVQDAQTIHSSLQAASKRVNFPLYYPTQLPAGFGFNHDSISVTRQVVSYVITYDQAKTLVISIQPKSEGVDDSKFNPTSDFTTTIGHAYMADLPDRTTAAVMGGQSWVLINAPKKIAVDRLTSFINSLRSF